MRIVHWFLLLCILTLGITSVSLSEENLGEPPDVLLERPSRYFSGASLALARAVQSDSVNAIDRALALPGIDINALGKEGISVLWWALRFHHKNGFERLLEKGANPNLSPPTHWSILELAAGYRDSDYLKAALVHGDANKVSVFTGNIPIFEAIEFSCPDNLKILLDAKSDLNGTYASLTPLIYAAQLGRYDFVYQMLDAGADPSIVVKGIYSLAKMVRIRVIDPRSEMAVWRQKVIDQLKSRHIDL